MPRPSTVIGGGGYSRGDAPGPMLAGCLGIAVFAGGVLVLGTVLGGAPVAFIGAAGIMTWIALKQWRDHRPKRTCDAHPEIIGRRITTCFSIAAIRVKLPNGHVRFVCEAHVAAMISDQGATLLDGT